MNVTFKLPQVVLVDVVVPHAVEVFAVVPNDVLVGLFVLHVVVVD